MTPPVAIHYQFIQCEPLLRSRKLKLFDKFILKKIRKDVLRHSHV